MSSPPPPKRHKDVPYELLYWPGLPGRGEHIRLLFEEAGVPYSDTAHAKDGIGAVLTQIKPTYPGDEGNTPLLAPPMLRHGGLTISQTPNILQYLGVRHGLAGPGDDDVWRVNGLALTALDGFSNEVHDCHHPIAIALYYEDQKEESLRRSKDYVANRLPKYLAYFERVLKAAGGDWLLGGTLTYADLVLFQCLHGTEFMFPKAFRKAREGGDYARVFQLVDAVQARPKIKEYLASEKRQKYSNGIWRYYEELDVVPEEQ
jgi:glutathione S-transferase